jgi:hypothetical protein
MSRASVDAAGFAFADGLAADPSGIVHLAAAPDRFGRILLACVEPLDASPRGAELAARALRVLRDTFHATPGSSVEALRTAFAIANATVVAENRPGVTGRRERRICIGATGVAIAGREIVVAQVPPSQAVLVQDGQVYGFPDLASWRGDFTLDSPGTETYPLGFAEDCSPRLYHSEAAVGDLVALCATSVGRLLGRDEDAVFALFSGSLLTDDLEGSVDRLERLLDRHDVIDAFAVVAAITRLPKRRRFAVGFPGRSAAARPAVDAALDPAFLSDDLAPPRRERIRHRAIEVAEWAALRRQAPVAAYAARQQALVAPGAMSVSRYRESSALPAEWRANLPRTPLMQVPARLLAASLLAFALIGGTGFAVGHQRDRAARAEAALIAADDALRSAVENPGSAMSAVAQAEKAITAAVVAGASGEPLQLRERDLARVRDQVWSVRRLTDVARIGSLPSGATGEPVRLALGGRTLYIAAGDLYELDVDGNRLVSLLSQGATLDGGVAGDVRFVSVDGGDVVCSDGAATYVRDDAGRWQRHALAIDDVGGLRDGAPLITWGDATYGFSWQGDIIRFEQRADTTLADIWARAEETPDLEQARDLSIDGQIHVLVQDGRTLTFSRGALVSSTTPFITPGLGKTAFIADAPFANDTYFADPSGAVGHNVGRVVQVDAGGNARQYLMPEANPGDAGGAMVAGALAHAEDLAVDELTGTVYWVANGELWRASMPLV